MSRRRKPAHKPAFPARLEKEIFETTAFLYPESIPVLLLVARRVKKWISPLRYRVISICLPKERENLYFRHSLGEVYKLIKKKPAILRTDVRHVAVRDRQWAWDLAQILPEFRSATNLLLFFVGHNGLLRPLKALRLQRLYVFMQLLFPPPIFKDFDLPFFANITHFDIWYFIGERWYFWSKLAKMPRLTHLSFHNHWLPNDVFQGALEHCKLLKVLALVYTCPKALRAESPDRAELATDPRFVMILVSDYLGDWETGARGGEDYWVRAEEWVRQRRSGETSSYVCDSEA